MAAPPPKQPKPRPDTVPGKGPNTLPPQAHARLAEIFESKRKDAKGREFDYEFGSYREPGAVRERMYIKLKSVGSGFFQEKIWPMDNPEALDDEMAEAIADDLQRMIATAEEMDSYGWWGPMCPRELPE